MSCAPFGSARRRAAGVVRWPSLDRHADRVVGSANDTIGSNIARVTVSISITLDDELGEDLNAATNGGNRSAFVAAAIREYLDRRAVEAAAAWHAALTGDDAAAFADFNARW